jgi:hypothetical protein
VHFVKQVVGMMSRYLFEPMDDRMCRESLFAYTAV